MPEISPVYVGIEIVRSAGQLRRAFAYTALDKDLSLLALGCGDLDEVLAYLGGQQAAIAAVNAPRQPNSGSVNEVTNVAENSPVNARLCEVLLREEGFKINFTPDSVKACPGWMRRGFDLYKHLKAFDYVPNPGQECPRCILETCADAVFWRLLGGKLPLPPSLEGRLQRQLILQDQGLPLPDAMDFFMEITRHRLIYGDLPDENIYSFEELNALAAAYVAWRVGCQPDRIELLGDADEGQIALPIHPL